MHKQSAAVTKIDRRRVVPSIDLFRKTSRSSFSLSIRVTARMGPNACCVDIAAHRHFTSPARLGTMGSVMVRAGDLDNYSSRDTSVVDLTLRIGFGVSAALRTGKEVEG